MMLRWVSKKPSKDCPWMMFVNRISLKTLWITPLMIEIIWRYLGIAEYNLPVLTHSMVMCYMLLSTQFMELNREKKKLHLIQVWSKYNQTAILLLLTKRRIDKKIKWKNMFIMMFLEDVAPRTQWAESVVLELLNCLKKSNVPSLYFPHHPTVGFVISIPMIPQQLYQIWRKSLMNRNNSLDILVVSNWGREFPSFDWSSFIDISEFGFVWPAVI